MNWVRVGTLIAGVVVLIYTYAQKAPSEYYLGVLVLFGVYWFWDSLFAEEEELKLVRADLVYEEAAKNELGKKLYMGSFATLDTHKVECIPDKNGHYFFIISEPNPNTNKRTIITDGRIKPMVAGRILGWVNKHVTQSDLNKFAIIQGKMSELDKWLKQGEKYGFKKENLTENIIKGKKEESEED